MSKSYVIQWKSTINGRTGRGTKQFEFEEAEALAAELNREYPNIHHEPVTTELPVEQGPSGPLPEPVEPQQPSSEPEAGSEHPQVMHDPDRALTYQ